MNAEEMHVAPAAPPVSWRATGFTENHVTVVANAHANTFCPSSGSALCSDDKKPFRNNQNMWNFRGVFLEDLCQDTIFTTSIVQLNASLTNPVVKMRFALSGFQNISGLYPNMLSVMLAQLFRLWNTIIYSRLTLEGSPNPHREEDQVDG